MADIFGIENCAMDFYCSKNWNELIDTEVKDIKFCLECKKEVYFCNTLEEFESNSKLGTCVAFLAFSHQDIEKLKDLPLDITLGLPRRKD